jgi:hypothetical protein
VVPDELPKTRPSLEEYSRNLDGANVDGSNLPQSLGVDERYSGPQRRLKRADGDWGRPRRGKNPHPCLPAHGEAVLLPSRMRS